MASLRSNYIDLVSSLLYKTYATSLLGLALKKTDTIVLMYHGVANDNVNVANGDWLQVRVSNFQKQMKYIKEKYNPIHLENIGKVSSEKPNIVVTFDDGYRNNYTNAYPILKELNIPATIFVATSMVDTNSLFWYDRLRSILRLSGTSDDKVSELTCSYKDMHPHIIDQKVDEYLDNNFSEWREILKYNPSVFETYGPLTTDMMRDMDSSGLIRFGSHTHQHEIVTMMSLDELRVSLATSLNTLKNIGVKPSEYFCFPNGWYDYSHVETLKEFGLKGAVTTKRGRYNLTTDLYQIPRIGVGQNYSLDRFATMIATSWVK